MSEIPGSSEISDMEALLISTRFPRRYFCRIERRPLRGLWEERRAVSLSLDG
jgi:hypothetical protein